MTPESITVSLDMAKKLKKAGWPQDALFYWCKYWETLDWEVREPEPAYTRDGNQVAAPTAEEILRRLPTLIKTDGKDFWLTINKMFRDNPMGEGWQVWYTNRDDVSSLWLTTEQWSNADLANASAQMWIYLKENSLLPE